MSQAHPPEIDDDRLSWSVFGGLSGLVFVGILWAMSAPKTGAPVAALFPPWQSDRAIFDAIVSAGGRPIAFGRLPGLVVSVEAAPNALRQAGAVAMFDGSLAFTLCLTTARRNNVPNT